MNIELHFPLLEMAVLIPLLGSVVVSRSPDSDESRKWSVLFAGLTFLCSFFAWQDFEWSKGSVPQVEIKESLVPEIGPSDAKPKRERPPKRESNKPGDGHVVLSTNPRAIVTREAHDNFHVTKWLFGREFFTIDELSAPLLPLTSLLYVLTTITTLRTKIRRFSFPATLISLAIVLATLCCKEPWGVIVLLAAGTIPPYQELVTRGRPTRVYVLHMGLFVGLMILGWIAVEIEGGEYRIHSLWAIIPLLAAVLIRSGTSPFHCWTTDLFEHATFGTALLFVTPMMGAYAALRLVMPIAPDWVLRSIQIFSVATAVYTAAMSLVQRDARRFYSYLFLSHSALVLVGLESDTEIGLTGGLSVWLSVGTALGGFGLTLRALESRLGRISLMEYQGLYEHAPPLAMFFLLTGLASVGFPGTFGFVGTEMLFDGLVGTYPFVGTAVVIAAALNSISIVRAYFLLFTGKRHLSTVSLQIRTRERFAVLGLAALILIAGLIPQPGIELRHSAAVELQEERFQHHLAPEPATNGNHHHDKTWHDREH